MLGSLSLLPDYSIERKHAFKLTWIPDKLRKLLSKLTFGFYITALLETYLLIMFVVMNEISENSDETPEKAASLNIAIVILVLLIMFNILVLWQWIKSFWPNQFVKLKYFKILFDGLKNNKWSRAFPLLFLLRRGMFWIPLFVLSEWYFVYKASVFLSIEIVYFLIAILLRPFESKVDNFIEIMNEVFYCIFIIIIWVYKRHADWNDAAIDAFFALLLANNMLIVFISNSKMRLLPI
jgi:hypothetical protein